LRAEYLLTLIPIPPQNAHVVARAEQPTNTESE
jgi:hypothetical protein